MSTAEHSDQEETEKKVRMDVSSTPPPRSPVRFFGESHFMWAPKKPCRPQKDSRPRRSARSLNFSGIPVNEEKDENKSLEQIISRGRPDYFRGTYEGTRLLTPEYERNLRTPGRPLRTSLVAGRSTARRIDFAALALGQNEPGYPERATVGSRTTSGKFIGQMEMSAGRQAIRQAVEESTCIGNDKSAKRIANEKACSSIKKPRLARLMR